MCSFVFLQKPNYSIDLFRSAITSRLQCRNDAISEDTKKQFAVATIVRYLLIAVVILYLLDIYLIDFCNFLSIEFFSTLNFFLMNLEYSIVGSRPYQNFVRTSFNY